MRSIQMEHFLSKTLLPSVIPGHTEKCWQKCSENETNMREKWLKTLPPSAFEFPEENLNVGKNSSSQVTMTIGIGKSPVMVAAILQPLEENKSSNNSIILKKTLRKFMLQSFLEPSRPSSLNKKKRKQRKALPEFRTSHNYK